MTTGSKEFTYRQLHAPEEDRTALIAPPFEQVGELVAANRSDRQACYDLQGRCLTEVSRQARTELLRDARRWTAAYRNVGQDEVDADGPIFLAGHQPQIFHPGVWFKNFALGSLAAERGAVAINLLIDSDTVKGTTLDVPGGTVQRPTVSAIPLDRAGPVVPFEERSILDAQTFAQFGAQVEKQIAPLVSDPLIAEYWPMAVARSRQTANLGEALAQSRHQWEARWGLDTLEIPQSHVCRTEPHAWFMAHLFAHLDRFRAIYNGVVEEYRRVHRLRGKAHPVPNLTKIGEWLEAPFWIWSKDDPVRRPVFVKRDRDAVHLSDRHRLGVTLPLTPDGDATRAVERLMELDGQGVKLRSRALITTLWARLFLGDLFIHGIGGAKYDQLTDALISRFFGLHPPEFQVLSATLHLPIPHERTSLDDLRKVDHRLRELTYHPEVYANGVTDEQTALIRAKRRWIDTEPTPANARTRCHEIRRINEALQPAVTADRANLREERSRVAQATRAEAVLLRRDWGFCLYPEKTLRNFFLGLLPKSV